MDISQVKKLIENLHSLPNGKYFKSLADIKTVMAQKAVTAEQPKTYGDVIVINESCYGFSFQAALMRASYCCNRNTAK